MKRIQLKQSEIDAFPEGAHWNAFVDLLSSSVSHQLDPAQLGAYLAFWYENELQNGGHLQYFYNRGIDEARTAIPELQNLGASDFAKLLYDAVGIWDERSRKRPDDVEQYIGETLRGEFELCDTRYYNAKPTMFEILEQHLDENTKWYVAVQ